MLSDDKWKREFNNTMVWFRMYKIKGRSAFNSHITKETTSHLPAIHTVVLLQNRDKVVSKSKNVWFASWNIEVQIWSSVFQQAFQDHVTMRTCERWQWCADSCQLLYTIVGVNSCHGHGCDLFQNILRLKCALFLVCTRVACNLLASP